MERVVGSHFKLLKKIGAGSFGQIYSGEDTTTGEKVAIKLESTKSKIPQLSYESKLYMLFSGSISIPRLHWFGVEGDHNVMVIDLMHKSLEDLFVQCNSRLSLKTVLMLADQMITCVEYIHNKNFIHRDIKPDNFVMGLGNNSNQVFVIDFGLSKKYRDTNTHAHIPYADGKSLTGTARYASINSLRGIEQSRRDDMESLGYVWLYLLRGKLPWMGLDGKDRKQKYDKICHVKSKTSLEDLCDGFPDEFIDYFTMVKSLRFAETPNYAKYKKMFRDLFVSLGYTWDYQYDWNNPKRRQTKIQSTDDLRNIVRASKPREQLAPRKITREKTPTSLVRPKPIESSSSESEPEPPKHHRKPTVPQTGQIPIRKIRNILPTSSSDSSDDVKVRETLTRPSPMMVRSTSNTNNTRPPPIPHNTTSQSKVKIAPKKRETKVAGRPAAKPRYSTMTASRSSGQLPKWMLEKVTPRPRK